VLDELLPGAIYQPIPRPTIRYKAVAVVDDEYRSIYDGSLYEIGERRNGKAYPDHCGGYYCYRTAEEAASADVPRESVHRDAPWAILECEVGGKCIKYGNDKLAYSWIQPIRVIA